MDILQTPIDGQHKQQKNSEMKCNSSRSRPYYFRRCKQNKSLTSIDSLPYELLFNILVYLSADDIYNNAMLVCRNWYNIIRTHDFIRAHLHHSTPGILVQNLAERNKHSSFVSIQQGGRIEVSKSSCRIREVTDLWYSCNGLILEAFEMHRVQPCLFNPVTNKIFQVPQIPQFPHPLYRYTYWMNIACSADSKEYKVVLTYGADILTNQKILVCYIATVGVDKSWRLVCTQHLSPASKHLMCHGGTLTAPGFIHCVCMVSTLGHTHNNYLLTLNVETETFTENPIPQGLDNRLKLYLSTGKSLSLFTIDCDLLFEVWDMKSETGEWTKMDNIDLRPHVCELEELYSGTRIDCSILPVGWLKHQEVVALRFCDFARFHIAYNIRTHEIDSFELAFTDRNTYQSNAHTNSLVGLV